MTDPRPPAGGAAGPPPTPPGSTPPSEHREIDFEIQFRTLVILAVGIVALALVSGLGVYALYQQMVRAQEAAEAPPPPMLPPREPLAPLGPELRPDLRAMLQDLRRQEEETLTTHGWVDAEAGLVRIPIDSAIDLLVEQGLPEGTLQEPSLPGALYLGEAGSPPPAADPLRPPESRVEPEVEVPEPEVAPEPPPGEAPQESALGETVEPVREDDEGPAPEGGR
jgi:hypothetical protein